MTSTSFFILLVLCIVYYLIAIVSVGIVYHRSLSHHSVKFVKWFEQLFVLLALPAGTPIQFIGNHRNHHANSDEELDTHSPIHKGFWYAHVGWYIGTSNPIICIVYSLAGPLRMVYDAVFRPLRNNQFNHLANDIKENKLYAIVSKQPVYFLIVFSQALIGIFLFYTLGGLNGIIALWLTLTLVYNSGDALNSFCHLYGTTKVGAKDNSKNNFIVTILTFGDGFHFNHHVFPGSANLGLLKWEFDPTFGIIKFFQRIGVAHDIKVPGQEIINRKLNSINKQ